MSRLVVIIIGIVVLGVAILLNTIDAMLSAVQPALQALAKADKAAPGVKPGRPNMGLVKDAFSDVADAVKSAWNSIVQRESGPAVVEPHFSLFRRPIHNIHPAGIVSLKDVFGLIIGENAKAATERLRSYKDKKKAKKYKAKNFDYVTFGGIFEYRAADGLKHSSYLLCVDLDHIQDVPKVIEQLRNDEYFDTALICTSPSGNGIKWVIPTPYEDYSYTDIFNSVANYIKLQYGLTADPACKDICRACFLPHDPNVYVNPASEIGLRKPFDVLKWLQQENPQPEVSTKPRVSVTPKDVDVTEHIETVVGRIEAGGVDIAPDYDTWLRVGFAMADGLGERGRTFFHRVSRLYAGYSQAETDKQFTNCLNGKGHGVSIATFFEVARRAGIEIGVVQESAERAKRVNNAKCAPPIHQPSEGNSKHEPAKETAPKPVKSPFPTLSDRISGHCPRFIQKIIDGADTPEQADLLVLGSLGVLGPCFSRVFCRYGHKIYFPCLFIFILGISSGGKGIVELCRKLVDRIHNELREKAKMEKAEYDRAKETHSTDNIQKPRQRMLFVPANSSATSVYQILADNDGVGIFFETEGDTLAEAFASDHGQYSSGFRKFAEGEAFSYHRRVGDEHVEITNPKVAAVLTGTPAQVQTLIRNPENGLYSRFCFYYLQPDVGWRDMFCDDDNNYDLGSLMFDLGADVRVIYDSLKESSPILFKLTSDQRKRFIQYFEKSHDHLLRVYGMDLYASSHRLAVIALRIAMIFSTLRMMENGVIPQTIMCSDDDFWCALAIVDTLTAHVAGVYVGLYNGKKYAVASSAQVNALYERLPECFTRAEFIQCAKAEGINERTAEGYITAFKKKGVIAKIKQGLYEKRYKVGPTQQ